MDNRSFRPLFSYLINTKESITEDYPLVYKIGPLFFHCNELTSVDYSSDGDSSILLFGDISDTRTDQDSLLANDLLRTTVSIDELLCYEKDYGGKYIIIYSQRDHVFLIPDATCSIPVFYSTEETENICADRFVYLAQTGEMIEDDGLKRIRELSDVYQAMPSDITVYRNIKALLPNHYLCVDERKSIRIINAQETLTPLTVQEAADIIIPRIERLTNYYIKKYDLRCPLTGGKDSRVVLAFLNKQNVAIKNYTIIHNISRQNDPDYNVPRILSKKLNIEHDEIYDTEPPEEIKHLVDDYLGRGTYSHRTLMIAYTIKNYCMGCGIINGDIIGQIGKCSLHRNIPEFMARKRYFRRKQHNYAYGSLKYIQAWIDEIKKSEEKTNLFDLFSVENRMGRWAGQENSIYNTIGQPYMNIFNSRSIIYPCTRVNRKERANGYLHFELLRQINEKMLVVPFGMDESSIEKIARSSWPLYYTSSILKYCIERIQFYLRRRLN